MHVLVCILLLTFHLFITASVFLVRLLKERYASCCQKGMTPSRYLRVNYEFHTAGSILSFQSSGIKLGIFKSLNESLTRVAVYISLTALYCLGGSKAKAGELSIGTMASFIGYIFTLTFAVQGLVNTFGYLRGAFAAVERINSVLSGGVQVDDSLAYGLERELKQKAVDDENYKLFSPNSSPENNQKNYSHYMSALKTSSNLFSLAWS